MIYTVSHCMVLLGGDPQASLQAVAEFGDAKVADLLLGILPQKELKRWDSEPYCISQSELIMSHSETISP